MTFILSGCGEADATTQAPKPTQPSTGVTLKLTLDTNALEVDTNTTLKVVATYDKGVSSTTTTDKNVSEDVTEKVQWIINDKDALEIKKHTLHTKKDKLITLQAKYKDTLSNPITLEIYKIINGHRLPPEPDPTINNSTLLGIDSNNNGVRDDVERWIYTYYSKPIEHAVMMQNAKAYQIVIQEPEKALETMHYLRDATACEAYWSLRAKREGKEFWLERYKVYEQDISPIQFNIAERFLAYDKYNSALSGGSYSLVDTDKMEQKCEFNTTTLIKNP